MTVGLPKSGSDERRSQPQAYYRVIFPFGVIGGFASQAAVRGQVYLTPFQIQQRCTVNKVIAKASTGAGTVRMACYSDNGDTPVGGTKLFDTGNLTWGQETGAYTRATVTMTMNPGMYWMAMTFSTSAAIYFKSAAVEHYDFAGATFSYASEYYGAGSRSYSKSTALPTTCPAVTGLPGMYFQLTVT